MICPMLSIVPSGSEVECHETNCAWWDDQGKQCSVLRLTTTFSDLAMLANNFINLSIYHNGWREEKED